MPSSSSLSGAQRPDRRSLVGCDQDGGASGSQQVGLPWRYLVLAIVHLATAAPVFRASDIDGTRQRPSSQWPRTSVDGHAVAGTKW